MSGAKQRHGGQGPSRLTRLKKPRARPAGQCVDCYAAKLPLSESSKYCAACRQ